LEPSIHTICPTTTAAIAGVLHIAVTAVAAAISGIYESRSIAAVTTLAPTATDNHEIRLAWSHCKTTSANNTARTTTTTAFSRTTRISPTSTTTD
jgi:hypothetical protein